MSAHEGAGLLTDWLSFTYVHTMINNELESMLQQEHDLSLNEFYVLLFLSEAPEKKLRLQQLQSMVGLSQSAMSRLVSRFEEKGCGALERRACDNDRRGVYTSLTPVGENKLREAAIAVNHVLERELLGNHKVRHGLQGVMTGLINCKV